jgi:hypothetical protein
MATARWFHIEKNTISPGDRQVISCKKNTHYRLVAARWFPVKKNVILPSGCEAISPKIMQYHLATERRCHAKQIARYCLAIARKFHAENKNATSLGSRKMISRRKKTRYHDCQPNSRRKNKIFNINFFFIRNISLLCSSRWWEKILGLTSTIRRWN